MFFNNQVFSVYENFQHPMDDAAYFDMVSNNSSGEANKTVSVGQIFKVSTASILSDNMIVVSGPLAPSIIVKMNKEKEFLKSAGMSSEEFALTLTESNPQYVKIISTDSGLRGSFYEASKDNLRDEFFEQLKTPTRVYDAKIIEKNRGGYFVNVNGIEAFLPGSLASANKIINFDAFLGKTVRVMLDSYINESNTFIVSNKRYIDYIMPEMINNLDITSQFTGTVTGAIQSGIFIEFNDIMTGLLSQPDMNEETLTLFKNGQIRPGDKINIWVRDVVQPKNFILTQHSTEPIVSTLKEMLDLMNAENSDIAINAKIVAIKGPNITVEFNGISSTISTKGQFNNNGRLKIGGTVKIRISSIEPLKNKIVATIINDNESEN